MHCRLPSAHFGRPSCRPKRSTEADPGHDRGLQAQEVGMALDDGWNSARAREATRRFRLPLAHRRQSEKTLGRQDASGFQQKRNGGILQVVFVDLAVF